MPLGVARDSHGWIISQIGQLTTKTQNMTNNKVWAKDVAVAKDVTQRTSTVTRREIYLTL